jgi:DNA-binding transcriptional MerR regulator
MRMRELEQASGVGRETIRYYIREGLLPEPERSSRNSASYSQDHVERLRAIKRLQEERFLPLSVIRDLLEAGPADAGALAGAIPMLDTALAARLESAGPARVPVASLGLDAEMLAEHGDDGLVSIAPDGTVSARDAAILRIMNELNRIGFTAELGFTGGQMRLYQVLIDWLTTQELHHFLSHTAGKVGEVQALAMAERGVALVNDLLAQLRTRALLNKLAERRQGANDNSGPG